jgi:hypothetical protein
MGVKPLLVEAVILSRPFQLGKAIKTATHVRWIACFLALVVTKVINLKTLEIFL